MRGCFICSSMYRITRPAARECPSAEICEGQAWLKHIGVPCAATCAAAPSLTCIRSTGTPPHSRTLASPIATSSPVLNHFGNCVCGSASIRGIRMSRSDIDGMS